ncbi:MAG TPA: trehalase family glycosidase [Candidatus Acidoferrales bacterium]|nr:trehalase family glycosidase [Candidatus Acidoferrales bacterium]
MTRGACLWLALLPGLAATTVFSQMIDVPDNLARLIAQEDTDNDKKITVHDRLTPFEIHDPNGVAVKQIQGAYPLSVLLQELKRASDENHIQMPLADIDFNEPVTVRTLRLIKDDYWNALTRRIDARGFDQVIHDPKVASRDDYLYVPASDANAVVYFQALGKTAAIAGRSPPLKIVLLPSPENVTGDFVRSLDGAHGLLSLALTTNADGSISGEPYVVPGGRFNELYCWDSYFITLGLLQDGRKDLARGMADNLLYEMEHYGKIPNGNRTYYLTRSQPPFLTSIIRAVYDSGAADKSWLASAIKTAMEEYQNVWMSPDRLVRIGPYQLSRYYDSGRGPCPEVEVGHYDEKIEPWLTQAGSRSSLPLTPYRFLNEYLYCGEFSGLTVNDMTLDAFFKNDRAMRESGHDTTHRFDDRAADFVSVDLNSLLYKYEMDFAEVLENEFSGKLPGMDGDIGSAQYWRRQAQLRREAMMALMWDDRQGFFFDYDFVRRSRSTYISATGLFPLWAKLLDAADPADRKRARRMVAYARKKLEQRAGLASSARESVAAARTHDSRQWDYPYGWPPEQILAWQGYKNYGFDADAARLAYRWLYAIAKNAHDYDGVIPEKYNVVTGSHEVFVEYGNVGTKFDYITQEGFGWTDASFAVGMNFLSPAERADLDRLKPPD